MDKDKLLKIWPEVQAAQFHKRETSAWVSVVAPDPIDPKRLATLDFIKVCGHTRSAEAVEAAVDVLLGCDLEQHYRSSIELHSTRAQELASQVESQKKAIKEWMHLADQHMEAKNEVSASLAGEKERADRAEEGMRSLATGLERIIKLYQQGANSTDIMEAALEVSAELRANAKS